MVVYPLIPTVVLTLQLKGLVLLAHVVLILLLVGAAVSVPLLCRVLLHVLQFDHASQEQSAIKAAYTC